MQAGGNNDLVIGFHSAFENQTPCNSVGKHPLSFPLSLLLLLLRDDLSAFGSSMVCPRTVDAFLVRW